MHGVLDDEKLIAYLDGKLPDDERVEIEQILETDQSAQKVLAALRREKAMAADGDGVISGFSCENCQAQYTIEFEKVRGKAFRVSCKKCGESIIIKGDAEMLSEVPPPAGLAMAERLSLSGMSIASFETETVDDVTAAHGAVPKGPAALSDGSLFSSDMLGANQGELDNGREGSGGWSSFRDTDSGTLSGAQGTQSTPEAGHSSSVLFSRSGLEHLAASAPEEQAEAGSDPSYLDESSGLMDIRALGSPIYADQDAARDDDDIMTLGAAPTSFNPPVLTVKPKQQMNRWMKITVAACGVAILVVAVILWITATPDEEDLATSQQIAALQQEIARLQEARKESTQLPARKKGAQKDKRTRAKKSGQTADTVAAEQSKPAPKQPPPAIPPQKVAKADPPTAGRAVPPPAGTKQPSAAAMAVKPAGKQAPSPTGPMAVAGAAKPAPLPPAEDPASPAAEPVPPAEENSTDIPDSPYATEKPKPEAKPTGQQAASPEQQATAEIDNLLAPNKAAEPKPAETAPTVQSPAPSPPPPSGILSGAKAKLDRVDVQKGMSAVAAQVKACAQGQVGRVIVKVVIGQTGRVASAVTVDTFAGTPVGVCAAKAVRKATFPISRSTLTVKYPFNLQ